MTLAQPLDTSDMSRKKSQRVPHPSSPVMVAHAERRISWVSSRGMTCDRSEGRVRHIFLSAI